MGRPSFKDSGTTRLYHICPRASWREAAILGLYHGSPADKASGFIHFSTAETIAESAELHCEKRRDLVVLTVMAERLGAALRWEKTRNDVLFPHLYGPLPVTAILSVVPLGLSDDGTSFLFPAGLL